MIAFLDEFWDKKFTGTGLIEKSIFLNEYNMQLSIIDLK